MKESVNVFPEVVCVRHPPDRAAGSLAHLRWADGIRQWATEFNIHYRFLNHWEDEKGHHTNVEVLDPAERIMFILRWS